MLSPHRRFVLVEKEKKLEKKDLKMPALWFFKLKLNLYDRLVLSDSKRIYTIAPQ